MYYLYLYLVLIFLYIVTSVVPKVLPHFTLATENYIILIQYYRTGISFPSVNLVITNEGFFFCPFNCRKATMVTESTID